MSISSVLSVQARNVKLQEHAAWAVKILATSERWDILASTPVKISQFINKMCLHCFFPGVDKSGTSVIIL